MMTQLSRLGAMPVVCVTALNWLFGRRASPVGRDRALTNDLFAAAKALRQTIDPSGKTAMDSLDESLLVGDYSHASRLLNSLEPDAPQAVMALRRLLPKMTASDMRELKRAWAALQSNDAGDPFHLQTRMILLVEGIVQENIPEFVKAKQLWLCKKASALAHQRAAQRRGAATQVPQTFNDCWPRTLYALPALRDVRNSMSYDAFLARVESFFPERNIRINGLSFANFWDLIDKLELKAQVQTLDEKELVQHLTEKGSLIACIGYFDADTSDMDPLDAIRHWHQHAMLLKSVSGRPGSRLFTVEDPALAYESSYTFVEFELLQLLVYSVEANEEGQVHECIPSP